MLLLLVDTIVEYSEDNIVLFTIDTLCIDDWKFSNIYKVKIREIEILLCAPIFFWNI